MSSIINLEAPAWSIITNFIVSKLVIALDLWIRNTTETKNIKNIKRSLIPVASIFIRKIKKIQFKQGRIPYYFLDIFSNILMINVNQS